MKQSPNAPGERAPGALEPRVAIADHVDRQEGKPLRLRSWSIALACIALTSGLQGCLLTRVLETRAQLCDDEPPRITVYQRSGSGLRVVFEKPTLTDRDVVWIVGYEPTAMTGTGSVREFSYEAVPLRRSDDHAGSLVARLAFRIIDGEDRLSEVEIPEKFNGVLSPQLLDATIRVVCKTQIGLVPPSTTFDLAPVDHATLPNRDALARLLGPSTDAPPRVNSASYQYCLVPCGVPVAMVANLKFAFGDDGVVDRVDASYFRYAVVVDLVASRAIATIELH